MIAKLWAQQIIKGEKTFQQTPERFKVEVKNILIEAGKADLIVE